MSPYKASASVLGIGVADIARTWGAMTVSLFCESFELVEASLELMELKYNCNNHRKIKPWSFPSQLNNLLREETRGTTIKKMHLKCQCKWPKQILLILLHRKKELKNRGHFKASIIYKAASLCKRLLIRSWLNRELFYGCQT